MVKMLIISKKDRVRHEKSEHILALYGPLILYNNR